MISLTGKRKKRRFHNVGKINFDRRIPFTSLLIRNHIFLKGNFVNYNQQPKFFGCDSRLLFISPINQTVLYKILRTRFCYLYFVFLD